MKTIRNLSIAVLLSVVAAVPVAAQSRVFPGAGGTAPLVVQSDPGAFGNYRVYILADAYPPPATVNPYGAVVPVQEKPTADMLIYHVDADTYCAGIGYLEAGKSCSLFVKSSPFAYLSPFAAVGIFETAEWVELPAGVQWDKGDIDGDGRDDLAGHNPATGEVVRVFRR